MSFLIERSEFLNEVKYLKEVTRFIKELLKKYLPEFILLETAFPPF